MRGIGCMIRGVLSTYGLQWCCRGSEACEGVLEYGVAGFEKSLSGGGIYVVAILEFYCDGISS